MTDIVNSALDFLQEFDSVSWYQEAFGIVLNYIIKLEKEIEGLRDVTPEKDCVSRKSVVEWLERCTDDSIEHAIDTNLDFISSVTPSYNSIKTELKPCEECISREEAKKLIQGKIDDIPKNKDGTYGSMFGQYVNGLYCAKTAISYMSSVVPQTKRGKWIETKDECEGVNFYDFSFECSKCGKEQSFRSNYCSNCGADMKESET